MRARHAPTLDDRPDLKVIAEMIPAEARVLDIGCGDGRLLDYLVHAKGVDGRGIELSQAGVNACVSHGLSVVQGDADTDLADYPDDAFDVVVLSQTLQATRAPRALLLQLVRIAGRAIVSFNNFGHFSVRWSLLVRGRMPATDKPDVRWYDTPNIHLCTISDFQELCADLDLEVERAVSMGGSQKVGRPGRIGPLANFWSRQGIFLLRRRRGVSRPPDPAGRSRS